MIDKINDISSIREKLEESVSFEIIRNVSSIEARVYAFSTRQIMLRLKMNLYGFKKLQINYLESNNWR